MTPIRFLLVLALLTAASDAAFADVDVRNADREMYPANVRYNASIPTPASLLGHELGAEPVRHHKLVEYITTLADLSDRISLETIGYSHERRPILFLVVKSANNRERLTDIKQQHAALTEPDSQQAVTENMPVVTWLNYGVHGAESSGMDAALPFIYHLAAAEGEEIEAILDNSVILVTAVFNPDGHAKRIAWLDAYGGQNAIADPAHIEHDFSWQFARTNHYWFDLNRQWLLLTQPEAQAWMKKWHEWRPNLTVDYHEMGSNQSYYFHPGVATRTNPLAPDEAERLMAETVRTSEAFLDSEARLYYHGESFDNYYVGKGSTFPLVNGGVGILYEASAALGREIETDNGLRTYRENIRKHFRTSLSSIEAGSALRLDYLRYQKSFYDSSVNAAARLPTKAWVFSSPDDPVRLQLFADLLQSHRIKAYKLNRDITVDEKSYASEDALVVPLSQPQHRLIRSIFESVSEFEDATFYDVSTWTMPPAFGLQYSALAGRDFRDNLVGALHTPRMPVAPLPDESSYAYVFEWGNYYAPRALQQVLQQDLLAKVALQPFAASTSRGDVELASGSILVPLDRQTTSREDIYALMQDIAAEDGVTVHALTSGRSATGTAGIEVGGPSFRALKNPQVLLVVGDGTEFYDAGEIWHLMDFRMNMPLTMRSRDRLVDIDWNRYTHIIFPTGDFEDYEAEYADRLRQWMNEGGTIVGFREASAWVRSNTLDWVDPESEAAVLLAEEEADPEDEAEEVVERTTYAEKDDRDAVDVIGGAIFSADLDITHPLGFGYSTRPILLHKNTKEPMTPTDNPYAVVIEYDSAPVASGYVSEKNVEALATTPALIAERVGNGSVILFADNPNFRGYWYGTNKLLLNSLFFSRAFDAPEEE